MDWSQYYQQKGISEHNLDATAAPTDMDTEEDETLKIVSSLMDDYAKTESSDKNYIDLLEEAVSTIICINCVESVPVELCV